jgi:predicted house-cleaning NTP pyrophosphatase (Maf/HAM1 superfamily)
MARIVLASTSPRRRDLLAAAGIAFEVAPADVDEFLEPGTSPEIGAARLALRKAHAGAAHLVAQDAFVVAADTIVALGSPAAPGISISSASPPTTPRLDRCSGASPLRATRS